jgi:hypothetical protein
VSGPPEQLDEEALASWQYEHREELDAERGEEVDVAIAPDLAVAMSFRLSGSEADAIRTAAREAGLTLSEWIRRACGRAVAEQAEHGPEDTVERALEEAIRSLDEVRGKLDDAHAEATGRTRRVATP